MGNFEVELNFALLCGCRVMETGEECGGLNEHGLHRLICLNIGCQLWNCLGTIRRCGLVGGGVSLFEWGLRFQKTQTF